MSKKHRNQNGSIFSAVAVGLAVAMGAALAVCAIAAILLSAGRIMEDAMGYASALALLLGAILGCIVGAGKLPEKRLPVSALIGAFFLLCLFLLGMALFEGRLQNAGVTALLVMGGSLATGLVRIGGKKQKHFRKRNGRKGAVVHIA